MKKRSLCPLMLSSLFALLFASCSLFGSDDPSTSTSSSSSKTEESSSSSEDKKSDSSTKSDSSSSSVDSSSSDSSSSIDSSSSSTSSESSSVVETGPIKIAEPIITLNASSDGLDFSSEHGTLQVKVNDGEFKQANSVKFEENTGVYVVSVKAVGDGKEYTDSRTVTYAYRTIRCSLNVNKNSAKEATITGAGMKLTANGEVITTGRYQPSKAGEVTFKAIGGFDNESKIYYSDAKEVKVNFTDLATKNYVLEDAEGKEAADLADEWTIKKYDGGWKDCGASIITGEGLNKSNAVILDAWNNYTVFRYSKNYKVKEGYNAISFAAKGDDIVTLKVQLMSSTYGVYTTYNLGTLSSNWGRYTLDMADANWKINLGGTDYKLIDVISQIGAAEKSEIIPFFDQFNLIISGATPNGAKTKVYLDDISFENEVKASNVNYVLDKIPASYVGSSNSLNFTLNDKKLATLNYTQVKEDEKNELELAVSEVVKEGKTVTYKFTGTTDILKLVYKNGGAAMVVESATGNIAKLIAVGSTFAKKGEVNLDFEDGNVGSSYVNANWTQYMYEGSGWQVQTGKMNSRQNPNKTSKVANFYTGYSMSYLYRYNEFGESIGLVDYLSIDLGNYFSGASAIKIKLSVYDTSGNTHYLLGGTDWASYKVTSDLVTNEFYFEKPIDVKYVQVCINSSANNAYLYADNLKLDFKGRAKEEEPVTPPAQVENELLKLDFQNLTTQTDYTSTEWKREQYKASGWTSGGTMRVRTSPVGKSIVVNMTAGWSTPNMFTYTPSSTIKDVNKLSIDLGNYFTGATSMKVKVFAIDAKGNKHYVLGGDSEWYTLAVTTDLDTFAKEFESSFELKSFVIVNNSSVSSGSGAFLYMDNIKFIHVGEMTPEVKKADLSIDFQNLTTQTDYTSSEWKREKYTASGWVSGGVMRVRTSPVGKSLVVNMTGGYSTPYMFTYTPTTEVGLTNKISIDLGNYFSNAASMDVKVFAYDKNGNKHFILGGDSTFYTLGVTTDLDTYTKDFDTAFEFKSLVVVNKSSKNADVYLYMDNIKVSYVEK